MSGKVHEGKVVELEARHYYHDGERSACTILWAILEDGERVRVEKVAGTGELSSRQEEVLEEKHKELIDQEIHYRIWGGKNYIKKN